MLTLSPIHSTAYYSELCEDDYYTDSAEPLGTWDDTSTLDVDKEEGDADPKPD